MSITTTREPNGHQTILTVTRDNGDSASIVAYRPTMRSREDVAGYVEQIIRILYNDEYKQISEFLISPA